MIRSVLTARHSPMLEKLTNLVNLELLDDLYYCVESNRTSNPFIERLDVGINSVLRWSLE